MSSSDMGFLSHVQRHGICLTWPFIGTRKFLAFVLPPKRIRNVLIPPDFCRLVFFVHPACNGFFIRAQHARRFFCYTTTIIIYVRRPKDFFFAPPENLHRAGIRQVFGGEREGKSWLKWSKKGRNTFARRNDQAEDSRSKLTFSGSSFDLEKEANGICRDWKRRKGRDDYPVDGGDRDRNRCWGLKVTREDRGEVK